MTRGIHRLIWGFLTLAIFAGIAVGVASTPWFQRFMERRVISYFEGLTGTRVEVGRFVFRPIILEIIVRGVVVHGTELPDEAPLLRARTVVVRLNPVALLGRGVHLRRLDLDGTEISIHTHPDRATNIPSPQAPAHDGRVLEGLLDLSVHAVTFAHSAISWSNQRTKLEFEGRNLAMLLHLDKNHRYSGVLSLSSLTVKGQRAPIPPLSFTARFVLSRTSVEVTSLDWKSPGLAGRCSLRLLVSPSLEGRLSFKAGGELSELAQALKWREVTNGLIDAQGEAIYRESQFSGRGHVQARRLLLQITGFKPTPVDLSADFSAAPQHFEFSNLAVSALGGTVQGNAQISVQNSSPQFEVNAQVRDLDFGTALTTVSNLWTRHGHPQPSARIYGRVKARWIGRFEAYQSQFDMQLQSRAAIHPNALPVSGSVQGALESVRGLSLQVRAAELTTPHSVISARGALGAPSSSLALQFSTSDFDEWQPILEWLREGAGHVPLRLNESASFSGQASGPISHPEIRGRLKLGQFEYRGWNWDSFSTEVAASRDSIEISSGQLKRGTSVLTLDASARLDHWKLLPTAPLRIASSAERTPVEGLLAVTGVQFPAQGLGTGHINFEGTVNNLAGSGVLRVVHGSLEGEPFDSLFADIHVARSFWDVKGIQLAKGEGRITGAAQYDLSRQAFSVSIRGTGLALASFKQLALCNSPDAERCQPRGLASFDLHGEGAISNPQLQSRWSVSDFGLGDGSYGTLRGQLNGRGKQIQCEGKLEGPAGRFDLRGTLQADGGWPAKLMGSYTGFHADPWVRVTLGSEFGAHVFGTGSLSVQGPLKNPDQLEARSLIQDVEVRFPDLSWKNEQPASLRYASRVLTIQGLRMRGPSTNLEVEGFMRFAESPALSLTVKGSSEATLLSLVDSSLHATGRSDLKVRVSGTPAQPLLFGNMEVHDVSLSYGDLPFRLSNLNGEIRLEGERAVVSSLRGMVGGGNVNLSGFVTMAGTPRYEVRAALDKFRVQYPRDFNSLSDGNLLLMGSSERGQLSGEVTVRQLFVSERVSLITLLFPKSSGVAAPPLAGINSPLAAKIRMNVQVHSVPPVRLETHDVHLVADIDLRVGGTLANPVQFGAIRLLSGEAVFRGNRYKVARGEMTMTNPFRIQPVLDLEVQTRVQRYDLTLSISGTLDQPKIAYRSDPPLPTEDILTLLALGYSRQQQSTAPGRPIGTVGASALLSQALSSQTTGRIQRLFGVSRIKIDPNVAGPGPTGGARVTVEQQVTPDLSLTYVTNTATSQQRVIEFEYALSDATSLVGVRDQNGIFGLELKFHRRFK